MLSDFPISVALPASDLDRARKFYEDVLGLVPPTESAGGAMYRCGEGTMLFVYPSSFAGTNDATAASWAVFDIESVIEDLEERGVHFQDYDLPGLKTENHIAEQPDGTRSAWFADTEGNILALTEFA